MYLYHLTLQAPTAITNSVTGSFSEEKLHEIVVARGRILELLRIESDGKPTSVCRVEIFGVIRSLLAFRLTGGKRDYIVVGSDSGRITILEFDKASNRFKRVHLETFGRSGCRRIVPGELLAADPRGRAVMIGALEKQKFVYILNRDAVNLTISSPLEAHKSYTVCFDLIGVDVGFDNPIFACLEVDYSSVENGEQYVKNLTFYELDLGLNHVVRKWSDPVNPRANKLITGIIVWLIRSYKRTQLQLQLQLQLQQLQESQCVCTHHGSSSY
jgi:splicing factor 3B subunit 3